MTNSNHPRTTRQTFALTGTTSKPATTMTTSTTKPVGIAPVIGHQPAAALETTDIQAVAAGNDAAGLSAFPFAALLMPNKARAKQPAANDDVAEPGANAPVRGGDANAQMRRVIAPRLVRARMLSGLAQGELARLLSYKNQAQLNLWEQGRRLIPMTELVRVAEVLGVSESYLLGTSPGHERDPAAGLRAAMLAGVRSQLTRCGEVVCGEVERHARLVGTDSGSASQFIAAGAELLDAVRGLGLLNPGLIDDLRGGAKMAFKAEAFEQALHAAKRRQRLAQALDADLRERLGRLSEGDIEFDGEMLIGDDDA